MVDRAIAEQRVVYGSHHGFRRARRSRHPARPHPRAAGQPHPQSRRRRRRAAARRGNARDHAAARQRARARSLRRAPSRHRAAARAAESRRASGHPRARQCGRVRGSRAAVPPRARCSSARAKRDRRRADELLRLRCSASVCSRSYWKPRKGSRSNNGTQVQTGIGILALLAAERALETAEVAGAMSLEGLRGTPDAFRRGIAARAPAPRSDGQRCAPARTARGFRRSANRIATAIRACRTRIRCAACRRCTAPRARRSASCAACSRSKRTARPTIRCIFPDEDLILSGGNFHGQPVAQVLDLLAIACADLGVDQ